MSDIKNLLDGNKRWASRINESEPDYFSELSKQQSPEYLWIGCSDSRVPANQITGLRPGEVFVHRNIANVVVHSDLNCLSVLQYAVEVLKVKHVIVCGHYGCGGVKASMDTQQHGLIDNWLRHIRDVQRFHRAELEGCADEQARFNLLCEKNVCEQVLNICATTIVQNAWQSGANLAVHGWIYSIEDGLLRDLGLSMSSVEDFQRASR